MRLRSWMCLALLLLSPLVSATPSLKALFVPDTLGSTVAYLEAQVGPAKRVLGTHRSYVLGACTLEVTADKQGTIRGLATQITPACGVDLSSFSGGTAFTLSSQRTFGQAQAALGGEVKAECLTSCGNAADPLLYLYVPGYHANQFIDVLLSAPNLGGVTEAWEAQMTRERGEDYVIDATFNCEARYQKPAAQAVSRLAITRVEVGYDLDPSQCAPPAAPSRSAVSYGKNSPIIGTVQAGSVINIGR